MVVELWAREMRIARYGAHNLRRTCAKLCRKNGGNIEQIRFLLGRSSIQTAERYLGSEQDNAPMSEGIRLASAVARNSERQ